MIELELREKLLNDFLTSMSQIGNCYNNFNWPILMSLKDYYVGRFVYKNDEFLEKNGELLETQLFFYGASAYAKIGEKEILTPFVKIETDYNYNITKGISNPDSTSYLGTNKGNSPIRVKNINNMENGVFAKCNLWAIPEWIWYQNYLEYLSISNQALNINRLKSINKDIFVTDKNSSPQIIQEIQSLKYGRDWAKVVKAKDGILPWKRLNDDPSENEQNDLWDDRINVFCELYYMLGYKYNIGEKSERNTPMEVNLNMSRFEILDQKALKWRKEFIKDYNKFTGRNAEVKLIEIEGINVSRETMEKTNQIEGGVNDDGGK